MECLVIFCLEPLINAQPFRMGGNLILYNLMLRNIAILDICEDHQLEFLLGYKLIIFIAVIEVKPV